MVFQTTEHLLKGVTCDNALTTSESYLRLKLIKKKKQSVGLLVITMKVFLMQTQ